MDEMRGDMNGTGETRIKGSKKADRWKRMIRCGELLREQSKEIKKRKAV